MSASSNNTGPSVGNRILFGVLATDQKEDLIGLVSETASSAESPIFRQQRAQSGAIEAKIRFKRKKMGKPLGGGAVTDSSTARP